MSDYTSKRALVDSIMENVVITTEEGFELRGEIVDLIKNQPTLDEKEIIRKAFERFVERLEKHRKSHKTLEDYELFNGTYHAVIQHEMVVEAYEKAIEIVKE